MNQNEKPPIEAGDVRIGEGNPTPFLIINFSAKEPKRRISLVVNAIEELYRALGGGRLERDLIIESDGIQMLFESKVANNGKKQTAS